MTKGRELSVAQDYRLRRMASLASGRSRILDVGCSALPNRYLAAPQVTGFDRTAAPLPANYTGFISGDASTIDEHTTLCYFDAVIAGEILEHLESPVDFLRRCSRLISPGGMIIVSTPNPNSPIERFLTIIMSRRFFYTSDHVCTYPQRWLVRMMELAGFGGIRLYSGGLPFPLLRLIPFPRPWCHQTIATGIRADR